MTNLEVVNKYKDNLVIEGKSKNTVNVYINTVNKAIEIMGNKNISELELIDFQDFKKYLHDKNYKDTSYNQKINAVRSFVKYMVLISKVNKNIKLEDANEYLKNTKVDNAKKRGQKGITADKFSDLIRFIKNIDRGGIRIQRRKVVALLGLTTGMRACEMIELKKEQLNRESKVLVLTETKGNKVRTIGVTNVLLEEIDKLYELYEQLGIEGEYVLLTEKSNKLYKEAIGGFMKQAMDEAVSEGVIKERLTPHGARKSLSIWLYYNQGWEIKKIADILGHSNTSTTEIYLQAQGEAEAVATEMSELKMI